MKRSSNDWVIDSLRNPQRLPQLTAVQWDVFVRQGRAAGLLGRLASQFHRHGLTDQIPERPAAHFVAATQVARAQRIEVEREVVYIRHALARINIPIILLKGAAYLKAGLPPSDGRLFSDTDILVPKPSLPEVESALLLNGWAMTHHDAYDQRYYREWMHELPPMVHVQRQTAVDVHHAIAPSTARMRVDSQELIAAAKPLPGGEGLAVLAAPDMVLHSMLHLLTNDAFTHALRDLSDLDLLLRHFGADGMFWPELQNRAGGLGLQRVLRDGLRFVVDVLHTPVPESAREQAILSAPMAAPVVRVMDAAWRQALRSPHRSTATSLGTPAGLSLLYLRAHWLRMPPLLLARHLAFKALRQNRINGADQR